MANTRKSTKRAKQAKKRTIRNTIVKSSTKTALKAAFDAIKSLDVAQAKEAYMNAVKALAKAASKGGMPKGRAARKISRLTRMAKKTKPEVVSAK